MVTSEFFKLLLLHTVMSHPSEPPVQVQPGVQQQTMPPPAPGFMPPGTAYVQGAQGQWIPQAPPGCPPGLEYLAAIDQLLVKQQVEILEDSCCCGLCVCCNPCKCYRKCQKQCCRNRSFTLTLYDNMKNKIAKYDRPLRCATCWCPCCLQKVEVSAPPGTVVGYVKQKWSICHPEFKICDASGATVLNIEGPICTWSCCGDVKFKVLAADGTQVGEVSKQWSGFAKEYFTDADNFGITFPMDLDVKCKATVLGACFLIDFMFFEDAPGEKRKDAPGMAG